MDTTSPISFFDPEFIADPYPALAELRDHGALRFDPQMNGWWALRHADMADLLRSPRYAKDPSKAADGPYTQHLLANGGGSMLFADEPDHSRLRGLVNRAFTRRAVEAIEPRVQSVTDALLDAFVPGEPVELMSGLAHPLPISVIAEMIGVDPEDQDDFRRWSDAATRSFDPFVSEEVVQEVSQSFEELYAYLQEVVDERRRTPRNDLTSALAAAAHEEGDRLTDEEIVGVLGLLLLAGNITTTDLIGNGVLAFLEHPDQWMKLCAHPELATNAVEEVLRYDTPVIANDRITTTDSVIGGCPVPARQWVWPVAAAANRDPVRHPNPDRFDIERADTEHHSFGGGPHLCLGAPLARVEARVAFDTLARRFPRLRLDDTRQPVRKLVPFFRGLQELWVVPG